MQRTRRTTIIVVGGALAIASVGYGLGTQADDGTAIAENSAEQERSAPERSGGPPFAFERGAPPGFAELADRLGVDTDALARAMRDFHDQHEADRREEFASALAKALGISADRVQSAFDRFRKRLDHRFGDRDRDFAEHERRFAERLASALGANVDDVKAALDKLRDGRPIRFGEFAQRLADELSLDVSEVRAALMKIRPPGPEHMHGRPDLRLQPLARALGVSRADLRSAFEKLRQEAEDGWKQRQGELARFLADRFDLDVGKVSDALAATAPPLRSPHPPGLPHDSRAL